MSPSPSPPPALPAERGRAADRLARLLDEAVRIPGTRVRIGLDGLLGLVPGVGDAAGTLLSAVIVVEAVRRGVPAPVVARMLGNVLLDAVVGAVPVVGDLWDFAWKANARNVRLLREAEASPERTRRRSRAVVAGAAAAVALGSAALAAGALWAGWAALRALAGTL